uniref:Uncharacterized protein n=2 Tax=Corethron hystrix TaxID=216773 RepID=A0A6U5FPN1_9STRA|mmetsp:Transcript_23767/g.54170  ORF Transcript_23767/g.54170 Transcript_23767/m.54170 type:complete len:477 (+) Transcript_23767:169-1599(+)
MASTSTIFSPDEAPELLSTTDTNNDISVPYDNGDTGEEDDVGDENNPHRRKSSSSSSSSSPSMHSLGGRSDRPDLPRILLMGPRRSGKTSIQRVVFGKMSPHETLFRLEPTQTVEINVVEHNPLCRFQVWDFPGDYGGDAPYHRPFDPITYDVTALPPSAISRPPRFSVDNIHDTSNGIGNGNIATLPPGLVSDSDASIFGNARALIFVIDAQDEPYDHVLRRLTDVVARAVRSNPTISVEVFINKVDGELFLSDEPKYDCRRDIMQQVADELAEAEVPDVHVAYYLTSIYDHSVYEAFSKCVQKLVPTLPTLEELANVLVTTCSMEKAFLFDVASKLYISTDSTPVDMQSYELCSDMIDVVLDVSGIYGVKPDIEGRRVGEMMRNAEEEEDDEVAAYDNESSSVIRLSNGMVLYLKEVGTMLALVCLTRSENFKKKSLVNYNIECFKRALKMLMEKTPEDSIDSSSLQHVSLHNT